LANLGGVRRSPDDVTGLSRAQWRRHATKLRRATPSMRFSHGKLTVWLRGLGPGLVTGAADDDPSGVATYSQAGAQFGYSLLWTVLLTLPFMAAIQLVSGRIGRATGKGVIANARALLPGRLVLPLVLLLLFANTVNVAADLAAMGEALQLVVGGPEHGHALIFGVAGLLAQIFIPYKTYARYLKWLTLALFAYVAAAFMVNVDWRLAAISALIPSRITHDSLLMIVAVLGTTISPYLFIWQAAQEIEEMEAGNEAPLRAPQPGSDRKMRQVGLDTAIGMFLSNAVAFFIVLTTAATLHERGITDIQSSAQAAEALRPLGGDFAFLLFALGIIGTGLLATPVLAGSAAYGFSEFFGWRGSLDKPLQKSKGLYGIIATATLAGVLIDFTPIDPIRMLIWSAVINGLLAPPFMAVMMIISSNPKIMRRYASPPWLKVLGWLATALMSAAAMLLMVSFVSDSFA
jgi:Mn2+/Fe2+ NRAMP family transporter